MNQSYTEGIESTHFSLVHAYLLDLLSPQLVSIEKHEHNFIRPLFNLWGEKNPCSLLLYFLSAKAVFTPVFDSWIQVQFHNIFSLSAGYDEAFRQTHGWTTSKTQHLFYSEVKTLKNKWEKKAFTSPGDFKS